MNYIKKYYPMVISIIFVAIYSVLLGAIFTNNTYILENESPLMLFLVILVILVVCGIWAEIIGFIIHAAKNKKLKNNVLWAFLIYFFHIYIIPYYNLKYVIKEKKLATKMIIFGLLMIITTIVGITFSGMYKNNQDSSRNLLYIHDDKLTVQLLFKGNYTERNLGDYDLYASDYSRGINVGAFIYDKETVTAESIQRDRVNMMKAIRDNFYKKTSFTTETNDKIILSEVYRGEYQKESFIYQISTIEFKNSDYIVSIIQVCFYEDYEELKEEFKEILLNAHSIKGVS